MADSRLSFFGLGLGVGAALGLLYAPKRGEEMLVDLRTRADEGRDFLKRRGGELKDQAEQILERGRATAGTRREQLSAALEAGRRAYREAAGEEQEGAAEPAAE